MLRRHRTVDDMGSAKMTSVQIEAIKEPLLDLYSVTRTIDMLDEGASKKVKRELRLSQTAATRALAWAIARELGVRTGDIDTAELLATLAFTVDHRLGNNPEPTNSNPPAERASGSLARAAMVIGIAVLAAGGAATLGAVVVSDVIWKEAAKAVISAAIGGAFVEAAERVIPEGGSNPVAVQPITEEPHGDEARPGRPPIRGVGRTTTAPPPAQGTEEAEPWINPLTKRGAETGPKSEDSFADPASELSGPAHHKDPTIPPR